MPSLFLFLQQYSEVSTWILKFRERERERNITENRYVTWEAEVVCVLPSNNLLVLYPYPAFIPSSETSVEKWILRLTALNQNCISCLVHAQTLIKFYFARTAFVWCNMIHVRSKYYILFCDTGEVFIGSWEKTERQITFHLAGRSVVSLMLFAKKVTSFCSIGCKKEESFKKLKRNWIQLSEWYCNITIEYCYLLAS
jgi:hypothetical protein